jgi:fructose-1,6-bisphosphatase/inositol monophosphatase family enzyme
MTPRWRRRASCRDRVAGEDYGVVIGEESTHRKPALLQTIADAELAFIVDPIDGTKNFASNLPLFGVMAAVTIRGEIIAGVIYDPVCRDWAYAVRGGGAWAEHEDGSRIALRVADPVPVSKMEGFIGTTYLPEPLRTTVNTNLSRLATNTSLRCAAHTTGWRRPDTAISCSTIA